MNGFDVEITIIKFVEGELSDNMKRKYGVAYTVPEHSWITINSEV